MRLQKEELLNIKGGAWNATFVNAVIRGFQFLFDLGKSVGSAISRAISKNYC